MMTMMKVGNKWNNALHALIHCHPTDCWSQQPRPNQEIFWHVSRHVHSAMAFSSFYTSNQGQLRCYTTQACQLHAEYIGGANVPRNHLREATNTTIQRRAPFAREDSNHHLSRKIKRPESSSCATEGGCTDTFIKRVLDTLGTITK